MDRSIPSILNKSPHLQQLYDVIADELSSVNISSCMMMLVDTVAPEALPFLAKQFDVLGYSGYRLATTDTQKREVIKQAIELKRYVGTVWAVRQAMVALGYGGATLVEGSGTVGDGRDWARFKVVVNLGTAALNSATATELAQLINTYKNARSYLEAIEFDMSVADTLPLPTELISILFGVDIVDSLFTGGLKLDGSWKLNGSKKLKPGIEDLQITII